MYEDTRQGKQQTTYLHRNSWTRLETRRTNPKKTKKYTNPNILIHYTNPKILIHERKKETAPMHKTEKLASTTNSQHPE